MLLIADGTVRHEVEPVGTVTFSISQPVVTEKVFDLFSSWLLEPIYEPQPVPSLARTVKRLVERTGWSNRSLADIVGTTHPTIQAIKLGREPERHPDLAQALFRTAEVVEKISRLANGNQGTLRLILNSRGSEGGTPLQLLAAGEYAKAYLRALDMLNSSRPTVQLLDARQERQPSRETGLIFDDRDE
jgi:hypothetical protein